MSLRDGAREALASGPRHKSHRCTDVYCLFVYLAVCAGLGFAAYVALSRGDVEVLERYLHGTDSQGRVCGVDPDVEAFGLTFYALPAGATAPSTWTSADRARLRAVCTTECPEAGSGSHGAKARRSDLCPADAYTDGYCSWYGHSTLRAANYCMDPDVFANESTWGGYLADLQAAKLVLILCPLFGLALAFVFLFVLCKCGVIIVWLAVLACIVAPTGFGVFLYLHARGGESLDLFDRVLPQQTQHTLAIALWVLAGLVALFSLCLCRSINQAGRVLRFTADFVRDVPSQMLQPIGFGIAQIIILLFGVAVVVLLSSVGASTPNAQDMENCIQQADLHCVKDFGYKIWPQVCVAFVTLWILASCSALSHYATAFACSQWYFSRGSSEQRPAGRCCNFQSSMRALCSGMCNHGGSLVLGSFAVTCCKSLRILLFWAAKSERAAGNCVTKCLCCAMNCLATCLERFVTYVTEHTYVEIAITGRGFCSSMHRVASLHASRPELLGIVSAVAFGLELAGPVIVGVSTGLLVLLVLLLSPPASLTSPAAPVVVAFLIGVCIGEVAVHPVASASRTVVHCVILDEDQHAEDDGGAGARHASGKVMQFVQHAERHSDKTRPAREDVLG